MKKYLVLLLFAVEACVGLRADSLYAPRHRVVVSTDIGGTDFDDFQSLVHLLLYVDGLDLEGLISSPPGAGRREHLLQVIERYERVYPALRSHSLAYPTPEYLRAIAKQGETEVAPWAGFRTTTEGSAWLVECARRPDPRPLHVLVWGGLEDLAQALHDAPDIAPKLRVYFIGGPNKKWSPDAYQYIASRFPKLWMIESNSTYRGWFIGGDQSGDFNANAFAEARAAGRGELGEYFARGITFDGRVRSALKMGDSPTVAWLLRGDPAQPDQGGWGGRYVRAWRRPYLSLAAMPNETDTIELFGILEISLPLSGPAPSGARAWLEADGQRVAGDFGEAGRVRFRFCPRDAKVYRFNVVSTIPELEGRRGTVTVVAAKPEAAQAPDQERPHWWTDDPLPEFAEQGHHGVRTISVWRHEFLEDFAQRLERCRLSPLPRPRLLVTTDFPPLDVIPGGAGYGPPERRSDPDDIQSMVRLLLYANDLEIEGVIVSSGTFANVANKRHLLDLLVRYDQVDENLRQHDARYPRADDLRRRTWQGRSGTWGKPAEEVIGPGRDTEASEALIGLVDAPDPRPLWVAVWGGSGDLAQALYKVQATRTPEQLQQFLGRLRIFMIGLDDQPGQDGSGQWMLDAFPSLFVIVSQRTYRGMFAQDFTWGDGPWLDRNIRVGALGGVYPRTGYEPGRPGTQEGDTPSFLHLVSGLRGLNDPDDPAQPSWGGQYVRKDPGTRHWFDGPGPESVRRWLPDMQRDFALRIGWTLPSKDPPAAEALTPEKP